MISFFYLLKPHNQYTIEARNRFTELCTGDENSTENYENLIKVNRDTAEKLVPKRRTLI